MADLPFNTMQDPISSLLNNKPKDTAPPPIAPFKPEEQPISLDREADRIAAPTRRDIGDLGQRFLKATEPYLDKIGKGMSAEQDIAIGKDIQLAEAEAARNSLKTEAFKQEVKTIRESKEYNDYEKVINEISKQEFIPTKETAQDLAQLFTFVGLIGFGIGAGGKGNAQAAMAAMTGMLEGHIQGNEDKYKREKDIFETNMKTLKDKATYLDAKLKKITELAAIDRQAGDLQADQLFFETGATYLKSIKDKQGLVMAGKMAEKQLDLVTKAFDITLKQYEATARVREQLAVFGIKQQLELGPFLREFSKQYPPGTIESLAGASKDDKDRIYNASQQIIQTEDVAKYIMENQKAVGALASAKNFINLDAIRSIKNNEYELADEKSALVDQQLDEAVKKGQLSPDDAQSAKVLQKKLFALALSDVKGSGQRGSIYLDKQFQKIYDQASRPKTLIDILYQREVDGNKNLQAYKLGIENNMYRDRYELFMEGPKEYYDKRADKPPAEVISALANKPDGSRVKVKGTNDVYVKEGNTIYKE